MTDNLSSASIQAANAAPATQTSSGPYRVVQAVEIKTEGFFTKHEKAIVIGAVVALFVFIGYLVATL